MSEPEDIESAAPTDRSGGDASSADGVAGGDPPKAKRRRRTKKSALLDEAKEHLTGWSFLTKHPADESISVTLSSPNIGQTSGNGWEIGQAMSRYAKLLTSLGADADVSRLVFGNSVTIEFRAREAEIARAQSELAAAERLTRELANDDEPFLDELKNTSNAEELQALVVGQPEDASKEDAAPEETAAETPVELEPRVEAVREALGRAVTDIQVAAAAASVLISLPAPAAPEAAAAYGNDVAEAYKTLATAVAKSGLSLVVAGSTDDDRVHLDEEKATRVAEELRAASHPASVRVTAFGVLSQADQEARGFGLRLAADAAKPEQLKRSRIVRGTYRPEAGAAIRDQGLWGKEVKATILVTKDALISTSTIRPPTFELLAVAPRFE